MINPAPSPDADEAPCGFLVTLAHRPRLLAGAFIMVATYLVVLLAPVAARESTRLLVAWNVGSWAYLGEFVYQAFVVGCTFASSDTNVKSPRMRRICVIQGVVGFFFNTIILALAINIAAGFF